MTQGSSGLVESYSQIRTWAKQGNKQGNVFIFFNSNYNSLKARLQLYRSGIRSFQKQLC